MEFSGYNDDLSIDLSGVRPRRIPDNAIFVMLPHSEVCVHMKVAGQWRWVAPVEPHEHESTRMAQIYNFDGTKFSFPITMGEAGIRPKTN